MKRNCRCCGSSYSKDGYWCEIPLPNTEPVGFCEFCDRNNKLWYNHNPSHVYESCRVNEIISNDQRPI